MSTLSNVNYFCGPPTVENKDDIQHVIYSHSLFPFEAASPHWSVHFLYIDRMLFGHHKALSLRTRAKQMQLAIAHKNRIWLYSGALSKVNIPSDHVSPKDVTRPSLCSERRVSLTFRSLEECLINLTFECMGFFLYIWHAEFSQSGRIGQVD